MKKITLLFSLLIAMQALHSQELESLLLASDDASKLTEGYINPAMKGLMYSMNGGWATTGKVHKTLGFDLVQVLHLYQMPINYLHLYQVIIHF